MSLSAFEQQFVDAADDIFREFGNLIHTFITQEAGVQDPIEGTFTDPTPVEYTVIGSPPVGYEVEKIDGTLIKQGDQRIFTKGTGHVTFDPELAVQIRDASGMLWNVVSWIAHTSGTNIAVYEWQVRR